MTERSDDLEELLETTWSDQKRRFDSRERRLEPVLAALFLIGAGLLLFALPAGWQPGPELLPLVVAYAAASLVVYPLGVGDIVPTQPFLVMLFAFVPAAAVPLLVFAGLVLGRVYQTARGDRHAERLVLAGGDSIHALGPALLFVTAGYPWASEAPWELWFAAFAVQLAFDSGSATVREWFVHRVRPRLQLPILGQVAVLDAALLPLGLLAVTSVAQVELAPLALVPLVGLLAFTARDRAERTDRLSMRFHALQRERHRLKVAVKRIGEAFASKLDLDALLEITTRAAVDSLNADAGRASARDEDLGELVRSIAVRDDQAMADALGRAEEDALGRPGVGSDSQGEVVAIAFALRSEGAPIATISLARRGAPFTDEERSLFQELCEQAEVAADNASQFKTLHHQALTDELTGLANHRRFQELLASATDRHRRTGKPAALMLLDLDHFKLVNDVHGHQIGDKVLRAVGRYLRADCRAGDEPARYGGEELAVVLADTTLEQAAELAERFRTGIGALKVTGSGGEKLTVSVSAGVAVLDEDTATSAALIAAADAALYTAKLNGRNRVELGSPASAEPRVDTRERPTDRPGSVPRGGQHTLAELAKTLARTLDAKHASTAGHSETVAHFSALIAEGLRLQPSHVYRIWLAGLVHDIGKISVPDEILDKPEALSPEEYEAIKTHSVKGEELLSGTALAEQATWVRHHHERFDGTGYPDRLAGEDIPLEARVIHVADAFEAMISDRPYRRGIDRAAAARELVEHAGHQFDPDCVEVLLHELELTGAASDALTRRFERTETVVRAA